VELVEREQVTTLVIGLPLSLDGSTGPKARQVLKFRDRVEKFFAKQAGVDSPSSDRFRNIQLEMWDERLTSAQAEVALRSGDLTSRQRRARIDKVAAQILLQSYLDCQATRARDAEELDA
jgi:putative Holliday junction resolvase